MLANRFCHADGIVLHVHLKRNEFGEWPTLSSLRAMVHFQEPHFYTVLHICAAEPLKIMDVKIPRFKPYSDPPTCGWASSRYSDVSEEAVLLVISMLFLKRKFMRR